jgi:hypothetical protein
VSGADPHRIPPSLVRSADASVVGKVYGAQLSDIEDPCAQAVRRTTGT